MALPRENIQACKTHGVVTSDRGECPCCETGVESRAEEFIGEKTTPEDLRWQIEHETLVELLPVMVNYLEERGQGPLWVAVAELDRDVLPAGYNPPERWFNVIRYRFGSWEKTIMANANAEETLQTLRDEGYSA